MKTHTKVLLIVGVVAGLSVVAFAAGAIVMRSGWLRPIDNQFGDQHLKTTVALVELHDKRFGRYPKSLSGLRFLGDWDHIALHATEYCVNDDRTAYFVKVRRGWMGEPALAMPNGFWSGTGFDPSLGPCS